MSELVQRLRDLYRWLELLGGGEAHLQGLRLLKENLSPSQRDQLELLNYFDVVGGKTGPRVENFAPHTRRPPLGRSGGGRSGQAHAPRGPHRHCAGKREHEAELLEAWT